MALTIESLYRKIAGIEDPLLCWALASTEWNDNGICIPKELCSKIRCFLPPSTIDALERDSKGGYVIDDLTRIFVSANFVRVEHGTDKDKQCLLFDNNDGSLTLSLYNCNEGPLCNVNMNLMPTLNLFEHETIYGTTVSSHELAAGASFREVAIGGFKCQIPVSRMDFEFSEVSYLVRTLGLAAASSEDPRLMINHVSETVVKFTTTAGRRRFEVSAERSPDGEIVVREGDCSDTVRNGNEYRRVILELAAMFI